MKEIFISYSSRDEKLTGMIKTHHLHKYPTWSMRDADKGDDYEQLIAQKINSCDMAILILSPDFFKADYIVNYELPTLLEKNKNNPNFKLLPILLRSCSSTDLEKLGTINIHPSSRRSLAEMDHEDFNHSMQRFINENLEKNEINTTRLKNPTWEELQQQFKLNQKISNPMRGSRKLELIAGPSSQLELFIPTNGEDVEVDLNIKSIQTRVENTDKGEFFVLKVLNSQLLEFFFTFCILLDDELTTSNKGLVKDILTISKKWKDLVKEERSLKDLEKGLLGELWFLENLITIHGPSITRDWRGSEGDRHDFRIQNKEYEIKTTSSDERVHYISSISQLEPSKDCSLGLISIQIAPTKSGKNALSVNKLVAKITEKLKSETYITMFNLKLKEYVNDDLSVVLKMKTNYVLSSEPMYMDVDDNFPKISKLEYNNLKHSTRISDIKYRLNVEGLGKPCSGNNFKNVIKGISY